MLDTHLKIAELFYSLQGEGARAGSANIFIRLQGCSAKHACYQSGVRCDTEFESGKEMSLAEILEWCEKNAPNCKEIIWTGGEPSDQLTEDIITEFSEAGFFQAIETSGVRPVPDGLHWVTLSPKVAEHILAKNFEWVDEIKYVRHAGQEIPRPSIDAKFKYLSPHSDGFEINAQNLEHCIKLVKENPEWRLSVQQHKMWKVL